MIAARGVFCLTLYRILKVSLDVVKNKKSGAAQNSDWRLRNLASTGIPVCVYENNGDCQSFLEAEGLVKEGRGGRGKRLDYKKDDQSKSKRRSQQ